MCFYEGDLVPALVAFAILCLHTYATCRLCAPITPVDKKMAMGSVFWLVMLVMVVAGCWELLREWFVRRDGTQWCVGPVIFLAICLPPAMLVTLSAVVKTQFDKRVPMDEFAEHQWRSPAVLMLSAIVCIAAVYAALGR